MKHKTDIFLNYISIGIMAVSGLLMNALIAMFYDSSVLGIFNESYAWYMVMSQISVWGIHMSILKFVPEQDTNEDKSRVLSTGLCISFSISVLFTVVSELIISLLTDFSWHRSLSYACIGLAFFSVNKVLLNYLNAILEMTAYAVFQSFRYILLIVGIFLMSVIRVAPDFLALTFPVTEIILFPGLLLYVFIKCKAIWKTDVRVGNTLIRFGTMILPSYMGVELNTKVDLICLGVLGTEASLIGIYSFAVLFVEGFYMIYITIRKMINPGIAESNAKGLVSEYIMKIENIMKKFLGIASIVVYIAVLVGYFIVCTIMSKNEYMAGIIYIAIICAAIVMNGKAIIFGDLLAQIGYPLEESILNMVSLVNNIVLNIVLIKIAGTVGAALATASAYFVFSFYLKKRSFAKMGIGI